MSLHSRLAVASGAAGVGAATLLLAQRYDGTAVAVLVMVLVARAAGPAAALRGVAPSARAASAALSRQAAFVPAWVFAAAAGSYRAGSSVLADIAGAHGVSGLAIVRGPVAGVAGIWLCALGAVIAIAGSGSDPESGTESGAESGAAPSGPKASGAAWAASAAVPMRMDLIAGLAQIGFVVALFAGPQIRELTDGIAWLVAASAIAVWAWFGRHAARAAAAPYVAGALAAAGLVLVVTGGRV